MNDAPYLEALNEYYRLKEKYDVSLRTLSRDGASRPTDRRGIRAYRAHRRGLLVKRNRKCVACGRGGGTIFSNEDRILSARCGNREDPCGLDIRLFVGDIITEEERVEYWREELSTSGRALTSLKFNHLFGYDTDQEATARFEPLKEELEEAQMEFDAAVEGFVAVVRNPEVAGAIKAARESLTDNVALFNEAITSTQGVAGGVWGERGRLIRNAMEIYVSQIRPVALELYDLLHASMSFPFASPKGRDADAPLTEVVDTTFAVKQLEVAIGEPPTIVSFKM
jgi:hypothetical protein